MKVYLTKDIEKVGLSGEIVKVTDGFGRNFIIARGLGIEVTDKNEQFYQNKSRTIEHRKEVIESKTSILAEKIKNLKVTIKRKMHNDGKLYGSISPVEIVDALHEHSISLSKSQVIFKKAVKEKGLHKVTIKLTTSLQPELTLNIIAE
jgi:large subunit ribosomal protein L9